MRWIVLEIESEVEDRPVGSSIDRCDAFVGEDEMLRGRRGIAWAGPRVSGGLEIWAASGRPEVGT